MVEGLLVYRMVEKVEAVEEVQAILPERLKFQHL